ncbi:MAG: DUF11 domain-containing protein [Clostridium sp.]
MNINIDDKAVDNNKIIDKTTIQIAPVNGLAVQKILERPKSGIPTMSVYVTHEVNRSLANPGDRLRYTVTIYNNGNMPITGARLNNLVDPNVDIDLTSIRINSVAIDQGTYFGVDNLPLPEISVQLPGLYSVQITFVGTITGNPSEVTNEARITYPDTTEPGCPDIQIEAIPLRQSTMVVPASGESFTISKSARINNIGDYVTIVEAEEGDIVNYRITITNTGEIDFTTGTLSDILPNGITLDTTSIRINGIAQASMPVGLSNLMLPALSRGSAPIVITFDAKITTLPSTIINKTTVNYNYTGSIKPLHVTSNGVTISPYIIGDYDVEKLAGANGGDKDTGISESVGDTLNYKITVTQEAKVNNEGIPSKEISAVVGDTINYIVTVTNHGNIELIDGLLNDFLSEDLQLDINSITVNGRSIIVEGNNLSDIPLGNLPISTPSQPSTTIIKFNAILMRVTNSISNIATISYEGHRHGTSLEPIIRSSNTVDISYEPDGYQKPINNTSAPAIIIVNQPETNPNFTAVKEVRTNGIGNYRADTIANEGNTVNYRITITNTGNVAFNLGGILTDILDNNLELDRSSVFIGNTNMRVIGNDLNSITLPPLGIASSIIVTFNAIVLSNEINTSNQVTSITYNYTGQTRATTRTSTIATVNADILNIIKTVSPEYATIGTILNYTVVLTNNSIQQLNNIVFNDILDIDLTLVPGSIYINNVLQPIETDLNNLALPSLPATNPRAYNTINFLAKVTGTGPVVTSQGTASYLIGTEQETRTAISNIANTTISIPCIAVAKSVNLCDAMITDTIRYTITITNRGNVEITNIMLADKLDKRLEVIPESIRINGVKPHSERVDIRKLSLPNLLPPTESQSMTTLTITFDAVVKDIEWHMDPSSIGFQEINRTFTVCGSSTVTYGVAGEIAGVLRTNRVSTNIVIPNPCLTAVKSVSSEYARVGDTLTYTIILNNTGNVTLTGIVLSDIVPANLTVDPSTIKINGIKVLRATANTLRNLQIPNMQVPSGESLQPVVVTFQAIVGSISTNHLFNGRPCIQNMATVTYNYAGGSSVPMTTSTNTVITKVTNNSLQYEVFVPMNLSPCDPLADTVLQVTPTVISISPSSQKYNIIVNVLYSIILSYRSMDGNLTTITKYYKVDIPNPNYTVNTKVTVNSVENPIIIKGHQVNVKLRFNITN